MKFGIRFGREGATAREVQVPADIHALLFFTPRANDDDATRVSRIATFARVTRWVSGLSSAPEVHLPLEVEGLVGTHSGDVG